MYTLSPWSKINICHSLANDASSCDNKHTGQDDYSCGAHNDTASRTNAGDKHNSSTTPEGKAKPFQTQCQKKQRCRVANDTPKHQNTDMGMFWLHNPRIKITDVFPTNLPEKVCVNFCCRGRLGFILCGSQFDIFSWFGMFSTCSRVIPIFYIVLSQQAQNHKKTGISSCFVTILTSFVHQENKWLHTHHDTHSQHQTTHIPLPPLPSETPIILHPPKAAPWPIVLPLHRITTHIAPAGGCNWIHDKDTVAAALPRCVSARGTRLQPQACLPSHDEGGKGLRTKTTTTPPLLPPFCLPRRCQCKEDAPPGVSSLGSAT